MEAGFEAASCSSSYKVATTEEAVAGNGTVAGSVEAPPWKVVEPLGVGPRRGLVAASS